VAARETRRRAAIPLPRPHPRGSILAILRVRSARFRPPAELCSRRIPCTRDGGLINAA
jgi:hypothetical protein